MSNTTNLKKQKQKNGILI